jgi:hypothetical protein
MNHRLSAGADSIGAGAPAEEIEITPAMIAAGVAAYRARDSRIMRDRDIVEEIYAAMISAHLRAKSNKTVSDKD